MKKKHLVFFSMMLFAGMVTFWSCKKDDEKTVTKQDAATVAKKDAVSNSAYNDVYSESEIVLSNLEKNNYPAADSRKSGALSGSVVITVTKNSGNTTAFPKEITVVYTNYIADNGIKKNGIVKITQSAKMREAGAIRTVTLDNFVVNDSMKLEGKVTITNQGLVDSKPTVKAQLSNGKVTFTNNNYYITREFTRTITWESGFDLGSIFYIWDDVYSITETANGSTSNGISYNSKTTVPLEYKVGQLCIKKGKVELNVGPIKAYVDFTRTSCLEKLKLIVEDDTEEFTI